MQLLLISVCLWFLLNFLFEVQRNVGFSYSSLTSTLFSASAIHEDQTGFKPEKEIHTLLLIPVHLGTSPCFMKSFHVLLQQQAHVRRRFCCSVHRRPLLQQSSLGVFLFFRISLFWLVQSPETECYGSPRNYKGFLSSLKWIASQLQKEKHLIIYILVFQEN